MVVVPKSDRFCPHTCQLGEGQIGPIRPANPSPQAITSTPAATAAGWAGHQSSSNSTMVAP